MDDKLLDFKTVCARYHFRPWGLRHRIRNRQIAFVKIGKTIMFDPVLLEVWIKKHTVNPVKGKK